MPRRCRFLCPAWSSVCGRQHHTRRRCRSHSTQDECPLSCLERSGELRRARVCVQGMKSTTSDSLVEAWASLSHFAGRAAIVDTRRNVLRTFAQIEEEARDFERTLLHEFRRGEVIVIQVGNHAAWPALLLAGLRRQLVVVPLERTMAKRERDSILRICCAAAILETVGDANTISGPIALRSLPHKSIEWGPNRP